MISSATDCHQLPLWFFPYKLLSDPSFYRIWGNCQSSLSPWLDKPAGMCAKTFSGKGGSLLINIEPIDNIRVFWMDNEGENKFTRTFIAAFNEALDQAEADANARALVLTGTHEKYFSTGLDLTWLMSSPKDQWLPFFSRYGWATAPRFYLSQAGGRRDQRPHLLRAGCSWRWPRTTGSCARTAAIAACPKSTSGSTCRRARSRSFRTCWAAGTPSASRSRPKKFSAAEALAIGEVDELASKEQLLPRAIEVAKMFSAKAPRLLRSTNLRYARMWRG